MSILPVLLSAAGALYGLLAARRRRWYRQSHRQHRLQQPVISVGNLSVGGSGKTPVVAHLARLLLASGERPAILSRGYGRQVTSSRVTVVSDGHRVLADINHAGDEPLMLARMLPGVPVVVARQRYDAGRHAETHLGATVHLLDDGYQHLQLARDVDLLIVHDGDLSDRVLPAGRLREPIAAAAAADALLISVTRAAADGESGARQAVPAGWPLPPSSPTFTVRHTTEPVQRWPSGAELRPDAEAGVLAVAGIARPERLFRDLVAAGWRLSGTVTYPDHHPYTPADVARIAAAARDAGAGLVITTAKDAVRLEPLDLGGLAVAVAPINCRIEPAPAFADWLLRRLAQARGASGGAGAPAARAGHNREPAERRT